MDRLNSEGIKRWELKQALQNPRIVTRARTIDACLLCRGHRVNEAGLCDVCWAMLDDDEIGIALGWLSGERP
ncbi:MAG: hypothetical protein HZC36_14555 [Armatimonadetes bacterium]|nr:hypothetical protein [Armatimonadota bacterium]